MKGRGGLRASGSDGLGEGKGGKDGVVGGELRIFGYSVADGGLETGVEVGEAAKRRGKNDYNTQAQIHWFWIA